VDTGSFDLEVLTLQSDANILNGSKALLCGSADQVPQAACVAKAALGREAAAGTIEVVETEAD
jgi:hypothetical protein